MRKIIYTICILIILVIAAFLVSPYFLGGQAQENFHKQIAAFNKSSPYITITPESYQRHWFSSDAQVKINFHSPSLMGQEQFNKNYTYNVVIKHGPLFFLPQHGGSSVHWGAGAILIKGDSTDFDGVVAVDLNWNNKLNVFADIPHLVLHDTKGNDYTVTNLTFTTKTHGKNTQYTLSIPTVSAQLAQEHQAQASLKNFKIMANGHDVNALWVGNINLSIGNITAGLNESGAAIPIANVQNITTDAETTLSKDKTKINSTLNFNIDSVSAMGNVIKPITFSYSVNGIDFAAYQQLMQAAETLQQSANTQAAPQQGMQLADAAIKILENGFTVKLNKIYVGLPKELASSPLSASAQLDVKPTDNLAQQLTTALTSAESQGHANAELEQQLAHSLPQIMGSLTKAVSANGAAMLPQSLVKMALLHNYTNELMHMAAAGHNVSQTPQELTKAAYDYLTQNKMLIPNDDGSTKVAFTFRNGQLLVNGEEPAFNLPKPNTPSATEKPAGA